jgi:hypothetical protein
VAKYFGWNGYESMVEDFSDWADKKVAPENMPTDDEILLAAYETSGYEGYAFVVYRKDGKLYEVNGSHCSCYGLEGQWNPEETTAEALKMRHLETWSFEAEIIEAFGALKATL